MTQIVPINPQLDIEKRTTQKVLGDFEPLPGRSLTAQEGTAALPARSGGPQKARWQAWDLEVDTFVKTWQKRRSIGDRWAKGLRYTLGRIPALVSQAGVQPEVANASQIGEEHVTALRTRMGWGKSTIEFHFAALRQFLRWKGNPVAERPEVWRLPPSTSQRRRWITRERLAELFKAASGPARLIVALEGFNGLRRVEVLRLRAMDLNLAEGWLNVQGKGRMGGKWRQIPLSEIARGELASRLAGTNPTDRIMPFSPSWADQQLAGAVRAAGFGEHGLRVSHHDLRRTFGRVAHAAGMDLVQLKNLYGHASLEMSVHYIGLDLERMREGLTQVDRSYGPLMDKER